MAAAERPAPGSRGRPRVGLALGGGVARSLAHVGAVDALIEAGVPIDCVAGTSGGALIGAALAAGLRPAQMTRAAAGLSWGRLVRLRLRRDALLDASGLEQFVVKLIGGVQFDGLSIPLAIVATDAMTGERVVFREGPVATAVRASCAIPGLFSPVHHEGRLLVDGSVVDALPAGVARAMGADIVVGVELSHRGEPKPPRNLLQVLFNSLEFLQEFQLERSRRQADVLIVPELEGLGYVELDRAEQFIAAGRKAAADVAPQVLAMLQTQVPRAGAEELP